jgi:hypothetical protein
VEDDIGPGRHQLSRSSIVRDVGGDGCDLERCSNGQLRLDDVGDGQVRDTDLAEPTVAGEPLDQLAAHHPRRAGDQDPHSVDSSIFDGP